MSGKGMKRAKVAMDVATKCSRKGRTCDAVTSLTWLRWKGLWQKQISTWDVEWYLQFNVKDQLGDMVHLCAWMGLPSVRRSMMSGRKKNVITPCCLKMLTGFGGTLFFLLNLIGPYILVACKFSWLPVWNVSIELYRIIGRQMSSEMTASCGMLFKSIWFLLAGMCPDLFFSKNIPSRNWREYCIVLPCFFKHWELNMQNALSAVVRSGSDFWLQGRQALFSIITRFVSFIEIHFDNFLCNFSNLRRLCSTFQAQKAFTAS